MLCVKKIKYTFTFQAAASAHADMMKSETAEMVSHSKESSKMASSSMMASSDTKMATTTSSETTKMASSTSAEAKVARRSSFSRVSSSTEMAAQQAVEYHQKHVRASSQERYLSR